ncbi:MAG TPA: response regulator [Gemmatimonadales bacterium]
MTALRVLVADDEPVARRGLRKLLAAEPDVEVVGEARDGREAVAAIRRLKPDVVLLDVQMPELDGIGVIRELDRAELPEVVFVTAYDRYAIAAFDLHAVDYVLKPVQAKRFSLALSRARSRLESHRPADLADRIERLLGEYGRAGSTPDRILVRSGSKALFVKLDDIEWLEASGNYVRLHTPARDPRTLVRETLAHLAEWLPPKFLRVHRSAIVNLDAIVEVRSLSGGDGEVLLKSGARVGLSRRHVADLHRRVGRPR